jgi:hypothetical protein
MPFTVSNALARTIIRIFGPNTVIYETCDEDDLMRKYCTFQLEI